MQEFRPASVIAEDTALVERLADGDVDALRALVDRYGAAVIASMIPTVGLESARDRAVDVFVEASRRVRDVRPGDELAPWLASIARDRVGAVDEQRWAVASATAGVDADVRPALRAHHLDGADLDESLARHELRLQRRLLHLGEPAVVATALATPDAWVTADDLAGRVAGVLAPPVDADDVDGSTAGDGSDSSATGVTRLLRPVLLGLGGALLVLFAAIVGLSALSGSPATPNYSVELIPTGLLTEVARGEITVTERNAGIEIRVDAASLPRRAGETYYEGLLVLRDGRELSTGTFREGDGVTLWGGIALTDADVFRIVLRDLADPAVADIVLKADLP